MFVDGAGQLYVQVPRSDGNGAELRRFDFAAGKPGVEVLVQTPGFNTALPASSSARVANSWAIPLSPMQRRPSG